MTKQEETYKYLLSLPTSLEAPLKFAAYLERGTVNSVIVEAIKKSLKKKAKKYTTNKKKKEMLSNIESQLQQFKQLVKQA